MLDLTLAHFGSFVAGWLAEWVVGLVFTPINLIIGAISAVSLIKVLRSAGFNQDQVERINASHTLGWVFISGVIGGLAAILASVFVFHYFALKPGLLMLGIFLALQFIPIPKQLPGWQRQNLWYSNMGGVAGLLLGWWLYYP